MTTKAKDPHKEDDGPDRKERIAALLAGYQHELERNTPRTDAELRELKELLAGGAMPEADDGSLEQDDIDAIYDDPDAWRDYDDE